MDLSCHAVMDIMYSNCTVCMICATVLFIWQYWANAHFFSQNNCFYSSWAQSGFRAIWWIFLGCGTGTHWGSSYEVSCRICLQVESFVSPAKPNCTIVVLNLALKKAPTETVDILYLHYWGGGGICHIGKHLQRNRKNWDNWFNAQRTFTPFLWTHKVLSSLWWR